MRKIIASAILIAGVAIVLLSGIGIIRTTMGKQTVSSLSAQELIIQGMPEFRYVRISNGNLEMALLFFVIAKSQLPQTNAHQLGTRTCRWFPVLLVLKL